MLLLKDVKFKICHSKEQNIISRGKLNHRTRIASQIYFFHCFDLFKGFSTSQVSIILGGNLRLDVTITVIYVKIGVGNPIFFSHIYKLLEIILTLPEFLSTVRISRSGIRSDTFRNIYLKKGKLLLMSKRLSKKC